VDVDPVSAEHGNDEVQFGDDLHHKVNQIYKCTKPKPLPLPCGLTGPPL
jgi:hypothetical protein